MASKLNGRAGVMEGVIKDIVEVSRAKAMSQDGFDPVYMLTVAAEETFYGTGGQADNNNAPHKQAIVNPTQLSEGRGTLDRRDNIAGSIDVFRGHQEVAKKSTKNDVYDFYGGVDGGRDGTPKYPKASSVLRNYESTIRSQINSSMKKTTQ